MVLVDTSVWSLALRRSPRLDDPVTRELAVLVDGGNALLLGAVRQEVLCGISSELQFDALRMHLRAYPDLDARTADYERAAHFFNHCRSRGVQGSHVDFLICALAARLEIPIFTTDADFAHYARFLPVKLHRFN